MLTAAIRHARKADARHCFLSGFHSPPEKALLDLTYLSPRGDSSEYIQELRLQNLVSFDALNLLEFAQRTGSAKLLRAAERVKCLIAEEENR